MKIQLEEEKVLWDLIKITAEVYYKTETISQKL